MQEKITRRVGGSEETTAQDLKKKVDVSRPVSHVPSRRGDSVEDEVYKIGQGHQNEELPRLRGRGKRWYINLVLVVKEESRVRIKTEKWRAEAKLLRRKSHASPDRESATATEHA